MEATVSGSEKGVKLVHFVQQKLDSKPSLKKIKRLLEGNSCHINGQVERFASYRVKEGDRVTFRYQEAQQEPIQILYEDQYYRVINKPAGITSEEIYDQLVHRLDKETSGVMVIAKTKEAYDQLKEQFKLRTVHKEYVALIDGIPKEHEGVVESQIAKKRENFWGNDPKGKPAITHWKLCRKGNDFSEVRCYPKTGRTHQIRLHMKQLGHPVLGDYHYCREFLSAKRPKRQMLHASEIRFYHPFKEDLLTVRAPTPQDFSL